MTTTSLDRLRLMLTYCRPMGSPSERTFINRFIRPLGAMPDRHGNLIATIGPRPRVLWSCHTDTVHSRSGRQHVELDSEDRLFLPIGSKSSCLGADDTAGIFILTEMLRRQVPGRYVFHYGEERGCVGSSALVEEHPAWLDEIQIAIALDRKGTTDVITHQGARTASDEFARELADVIGLDYEPSDRGIYTDTERYAGIVPECTNLSIGYEHAHSASEWLDGRHVLALLDRLLTVNLDAVGVYRDPSVPDPDEAWMDEWLYDDFGRPSVRDDRRDSQYLDPAFGEVQRNLWDEPESVLERDERNRRELEAWFRSVGQKRYTK
jgi:peptidase M28-like protein